MWYPRSLVKKKKVLQGKGNKLCQMLLTGQIRGEKRRQEQIHVIAQKEKESREMRRLSEEQKGKENFFCFFFF